MNLEEYGTLLAAKHEMLSPQEFQDFLIEETMERMRVNVGLITENEQLRRRVQQLEEGKPNPASHPPYES